MRGSCEAAKWLHVAVDAAIGAQRERSDMKRSIKKRACGRAISSFAYKSRLRFLAFGAVVEAAAAAATTATATLLLLLLPHTAHI